MTGTPAFSQFNFDSIRVCHNKENELLYLSVGQYEIDLQKGKLQSFQLKSGSILYREPDRLFILHHSYASDTLSIQLVHAGVWFTTKDTSILINKLPALNHPLSMDGASHVFVQLAAYGFWLDFYNGTLNKITCPIDRRSLIIKPHSFRNVFDFWDFMIEGTGPEKDVLVMGYALNAPQFITIEDYRSKVGFRLFSNKKNGIYDVLTGLRMFDENNFGSDTHYQFKYSQRGKMKKSSRRFGYACIVNSL